MDLYKAAQTAYAHVLITLFYIVVSIKAVVAEWLKCLSTQMSAVGGLRPEYRLAD